MPPVGNADKGGGQDGFSGAAIAKMIFINMFQDWISKRKISLKAKFILFVLVYFGNMSYNTTKFIDQRPHTLYDHFEISRLANFDEIKTAKNLYLQRMQDLNNPDYEGDKSILVNYTMTE